MIGNVWSVIQLNLNCPFRICWEYLWRGFFQIAPYWEDVLRDGETRSRSDRRSRFDSVGLKEREYVCPIHLYRWDRSVRSKSTFKSIEPIDLDRPDRDAYKRRNRLCRIIWRFGSSRERGLSLVTQQDIIWSKAITKGMVLQDCAYTRRIRPQTIWIGSLHLIEAERKFGPSNWGDRITGKVFWKFVHRWEHSRVSNGDFVDKLYVVDKSIFYLLFLWLPNQKTTISKNPRIPLANFSLTCWLATSCIAFGRRMFCCCQGAWGTVWITIGGSIAGFNSRISESSNAIASSYSYRMLMNIYFSFSDRKSVPIWMLASRSGVNQEPRGTLRPPARSFDWRSRSLGDSALTPPPGLIPPDKGTFAGWIFLSLRLYIVLTFATYFSNFPFDIISPNSLSFAVSIVMVLTPTFGGPMPCSITARRVIGAWFAPKSHVRVKVVS